MNSDGQIDGIGGNVLGYNLFAYCTNNPINMADKNGNWPSWAKKIVNTVKSIIERVTSIVNSVVQTTASITSQFQAEKKNFVPRKDKRKGSENRQKTGNRERNVAHPNGEEHSRVPKGNGVKRYGFSNFNDFGSNIYTNSYEQTLQVVLVGSVVLTLGTIATVSLVADDATILGIADDVAIVPILLFMVEGVRELCY